MLEPSREIGTLLRPFLSKFFCIFLENKCNSCTRKKVYTRRIIERREKKRNESSFWEKIYNCNRNNKRDVACFTRCNFREYYYWPNSERPPHLNMTHRSSKIAHILNNCKEKLLVVLKVEISWVFLTIIHKKNMLRTFYWYLIKNSFYWYTLTCMPIWSACEISASILLSLVRRLKNKPLMRSRSSRCILNLAYSWGLDFNSTIALNFWPCHQ